MPSLDKLLQDFEDKFDSRSDFKTDSETDDLDNSKTDYPLSKKLKDLRKKFSDDELEFIISKENHIQFVEDVLTDFLNDRKEGIYSPLDIAAGSIAYFIEGALDETDDSDSTLESPGHEGYSNVELTEENLRKHNKIIKPR